MSTFHIKPSCLQGKIIVPSSKSHTLRALLFALMGKGKSIIRNYLDSPDVDAMIAAISQFGAQVSIFRDAIEVEGVDGRLQPAQDVVDAGNSGQLFRFMAALSALLPTYTIFTGDHSI